MLVLSGVMFMNIRNGIPVSCTVFCFFLAGLQIKNEVSFHGAIYFTCKSIYLYLFLTVSILEILSIAIIMLMLLNTKKST